MNDGPTTRFSNRVENYIRYRPGYPPEILGMLETECGLRRESVIADIGSGTGILTRIFLEHGNPVFAVEPNKDMREAAERLLGGWSRLRSIAAAAEATSLADHSVDIIVAGQAFHWFDQEQCRAEFQRILKPNGWVVLLWNDRRTDSSPFLVAYEKLLRKHSTDYTRVDHKQINLAVLRKFFGADPALREFPNHQHFHLESLTGRLLSSSYAPAEGQPGHPEMMADLERIFTTHQKNGEVVFEYDTKVYFARLKPRAS